VRIGVISDIHGDLSALQAVWAALERDGLARDLILNAGDTVGYGPAPEECVAFVRARTISRAYAGNYDKNVRPFPRKPRRSRKNGSAVVRRSLKHCARIARESRGNSACCRISPMRSPMS